MTLTAISHSSTRTLPARGDDAGRPGAHVRSGRAAIMSSPPPTVSSWRAVITATQRRAALLFSCTAFACHNSHGPTTLPTCNGATAVRCA